VTRKKNTLNKQKAFNNEEAKLEKADNLRSDKYKVFKDAVAKIEEVKTYG